MKKYFVRFVALALSTMLVISMFHTPLSSRVMAAEANVIQDYNSPNDTQQSSKLEPFTSTEDLIAKMEAELLQKGELYTVDRHEEQALQTLSDIVEMKCGYTLTEIKSLLAISIFQERDQEIVDITTYNLSKDEMQQIIDLVLEDYCATESVDVSINADENSIAQTISVDMNIGFKAGLDALDEMQGVGKIYPASETIDEDEKSLNVATKAPMNC